MPQVTIHATGAGDGFVQSADTVYANARAGAGTFSLFPTNTYFYVGQEYRGSQSLHICRETFLAFDIPGNVPVGAVITGIELRLWLESDQSVTDFICEARTHPWSAGGLEISDFVAGADLASKTLLATLDTNGIGAAGEYKSFVSTAALNGWDRANVLEMVIASSRLRTGDAPAGFEQLLLRSANYSSGTLAPYIIVTYTLPKAGWISWPLRVLGVRPGAHVSRIRIRAADPYHKTSDWSVSKPFTVLQNAYPTGILIAPEAGELMDGNTPHLVWEVADADGDGIHIECKLALNSSFTSGWHWHSALAQTDWEEAADPYSSWTALPEGGATSGNRVRFQCPPLRYDTYWLTWRLFDGILYSDWSNPIAVRITPTGTEPLTCTIGEESYKIMSTRIVERTGGEASTIEFRLDLVQYRAKPIAKGAPVSVGFAIYDEATNTVLTRSWNGTSEQPVSSGAEVSILALMDDVYLARKLVTGDSIEQDVGQSLADFIDTYGEPQLGSAHVDTSLGVVVPIKGKYNSLLAIYREWAQLLGLMLWVDTEGEVHLVEPSTLPDPDYVLIERYEP